MPTLALRARATAWCDGPYSVASDVAAGMAAGVTGTPTVFVNGRMIAGAQSFDGFERVVLEELELEL